MLAPQYAAPVTASQLKPIIQSSVLSETQQGLHADNVREDPVSINALHETAKLAVPLI